jgi:hypothetical protein
MSRAAWGERSADDREAAAVGGHIILTIAQVHASRGGAGGNRWKSRGAQRPKQTDVRINVAKDQRRFEMFTIRAFQQKH